MYNQQFLDTCNQFLIVAYQIKQETGKVYSSDVAERLSVDLSLKDIEEIGSYLNKLQLIDKKSYGTMQYKIELTQRGIEQVELMAVV